MIDHEVIMDEDSSFYSLVKPQEPIHLFVSELTSITDEMVKYALPLPDVMTELYVFNWEFLTKVNCRQHHIVLNAHNGKILDIPFLFEKWNITTISQNFVLCFTLIPRYWPSDSSQTSLFPLNLYSKLFLSSLQKTRWLIVA